MTRTAIGVVSIVLLLTTTLEVQPIAAGAAIQEQLASIDHVRLLVSVPPGIGAESRREEESLKERVVDRVERHLDRHGISLSEDPYPLLILSLKRIDSSEGEEIVAMYATLELVEQVARVHGKKFRKTGKVFSATTWATQSSFLARPNTKKFHLFEMVDWMVQGFGGDVMAAKRLEPPEYEWTEDNWNQVPIERPK